MTQFLSNAAAVGRYAVVTTATRLQRDCDSTAAWLPCRFGASQASRMGIAVVSTTFVINSVVKGRLSGSRPPYLRSSLTSLITYRVRKFVATVATSPTDTDVDDDDKRLMQFVPETVRAFSSAVRSLAVGREITINFAKGSGLQKIDPWGRGRRTWRRNSRRAPGGPSSKMIDRSLRRCVSSSIVRRRLGWR